jgi:hypothetical protein
MGYNWTIMIIVGYNIYPTVIIIITIIIIIQL